MAYSVVIEFTQFKEGWPKPKVLETNEWYLKNENQADGINAFHALSDLASKLVGSLDPTLNPPAS